jgi:hypothetical protein
LADEGSVFWAGNTAFALFNGPTIGLMYDINNRITDFSEFGTALPMVGW